MTIQEIKNTAYVVGIFGGNSDASVAELAENLGRGIAQATKWIVLTGGAGPKNDSPKVKERALVGPDEAGRPWIGILQNRDDLPTHPFPNGFIFKTPLGDRRNYLEAALCDGAIALTGKEGTTSEFTAALCLGKPVVLLGEGWVSARPDAAGHVSDNIKAKWIEVAQAKLEEDDSSPAIDELIRRDIRLDHLEGVENRCKVADGHSQAIDSLAELLARARHA